MNHLGVEHGGVIAALLVGGDRIGRVLRHRIDAKTLGQAGHPVAVAHPDGIAFSGLPDAVEEGAGFADLDVGAAEFSRMPALDPAAELLAERLLAVADGEDRNAAGKDRFGGARAARFRHGGRAAGEDHRPGPQPLERLARLHERVDFAVDARLAHAPGDQLGDLGAEVDDEDEVVMHVLPLAESARGRNAGGSRFFGGCDQRVERFLQPPGGGRIRQNVVGRDALAR